MNNKKIEWGMEAIQLGSEIADVTKDLGVPGLGLIGKFSQVFYDKYLHLRFSKFCSDCDLNEELLKKIQSNEDYSNCLYSILETVRRTHSKLGLTALAIIYRENWNDSKTLISAARAFAEISDETINAFIELYESIPKDKNYIELKEIVNGKQLFHHLYNEAVELINRNFFIQTAYTSMNANMPIQGMKWEHTEKYYKYCCRAKEFV